jgi:hypothetical protein
VWTSLRRDHVICYRDQEKYTEEDSPRMDRGDHVHAEEGCCKEQREC